MPVEITMPRLSDTMEEGTLVRWRVQLGDTVRSGDLLADIETDKATMELQSYDDGTVAQLSIGEGDSVPVGVRILVLAEPGEEPEQALSGLESASGDAVVAVGAEEASGAVTAEAGRAGAAGSGAISGRVRVSPLARKLAEETGVDLSAILGSGPGGRVIKRDIVDSIGGSATKQESAGIAGGVVMPQQRGGPSVPAPMPVAEPLEAKSVPITGMRKTIARRLVESKTTIPHFTVTVRVDAEALLGLRATVNEQLANSGDGTKLSVNDFVVRAAAMALVRHPGVNSTWTEQAIQQHGTVNVGVAVALPAERGGGLVVPTIHDAQAKGVRTISAQTQALAAKARGQGLSPEEMADGTFTVSNLGMFGVEHFEAIINPPQAAILAVGAAVEQPVVREGQLGVGREMSLTLSADHRVVDGAMAAAYLRTLKELLENPSVLLV